MRGYSSYLTHCNAGTLATAGMGSALAGFYEAKRREMNLRVYADEIRPLLQEARLTAWELCRAGIDTTVICDNMAEVLMKRGMIDTVIAGADRIAANGDAANKIGTYSLSVLAKHHGVKFYAADPSSTFDMSLETDEGTVIEQRDDSEVRGFAGALWYPSQAKVFNPAFDVTPAEKITAIITERGVIENPSRSNVAGK